MKSIITDQKTIQELRRISENNGGILKPINVVDSAREEDSPLHGYFEWDDSKAAESYRIEQARGLLQKVQVLITSRDGDDRMSRVFVSLSTDREEGGYREIVSVLSNSRLREQLIRDALSDMQSFTQRYKDIRELVSVFSEMKKVMVKLK